jgi:hypothetical protein
MHSEANAEADDRAVDHEVQAIGVEPVPVL